MARPSRPIKLAISTCPNDTFAFHAILEQKIDFKGLTFDIELLDIAELNQGLFNRDFDIVKTSFFAAMHAANDFIVLPSGSAIGFGNGPLLLTNDPTKELEDEKLLTLCPGPNTTASFLFRLFYGKTRIKNVVFSEIMPAVAVGKADFGVCIHEGRFTFEEHGLSLVEDLGNRWESETQTPLPLGGILASKYLGSDTIAIVQKLIYESIQYGLANRNETLSSMRKHAQEFDDAVLFQHVDLYVNAQTVLMDSIGKASIQQMHALANDKLLLDQEPLTIWSANV